MNNTNNTNNTNNMSGINWFTSTLKERYTTFSGRASRTEFWYFQLFIILIYIILAVIEIFFGLNLNFGSSNTTSLQEIDEMGKVGVLTIIFTVLIFLPSLALVVRRLHDTNRSAWWLLLYFVPLIGALIILIFMVLDGEKGTNKYGEDPKVLKL